MKDKRTKKELFEVIDALQKGKAAEEKMRRDAVHQIEVLTGTLNMVSDENKRLCKVVDHLLDSIV